MLDRFSSRKNIPRDRFREDYTPDQAVSRYKLVNPSGENLYVLFPPWHGGGWAYEVLIRRLTRKGNVVLAFYFRDEILQPNTEKVVASFGTIRDIVSGQITHTVNEHSYAYVHGIAMSLGNPAFSMVSSKFSGFTSATLVTPASSLAKSMWNGIRTTHIRAGIEQQGYNLAKLEEAWHDLAPINHLDALRGKNIRLVVSTNDEVIPTAYQNEFVAAAQTASIDPIVETSRLGHYATIAKFCLFDVI